MPRGQSCASTGTSDGTHRPEPALLRAVKENDIESLREILDTADRHGRPIQPLLNHALVLCAEFGRDKAAAYLLGAGASPKTPGKGYARTAALMRAVESDHIDVVKVLLDWKSSPVDVNEADEKGRTVLMTAAWKGHGQILDQLILAGADVNAKDYRKRNVLHNLAADVQCHWDLEIVGNLVRHKVGLEGSQGWDEHHRTPLHWCCVTGKYDFANILLKANSDIVNALDKQHKTPLHAAVLHGHDNMEELLLHFNASTTLASEGGWTALHNACETGNSGIVRRLLGANADPNTRLQNGRTPLHIASSAGHAEVVATLLFYRGRMVDRNARDASGYTSFLLAAKEKHWRCVEFLDPTNDPDCLPKKVLKAATKFKATIVDFGEFAGSNQIVEMNIHELLYSTPAWRFNEHAHNMRPTNSKATQFRWIHLPANNLAWVETLMAKCFIEDKAYDVEGFKTIELSCTNQHRGNRVHSRFMRPTCHTAPRMTSNTDSPAKISASGHIDVPVPSGDGIATSLKSSDESTRWSQISQAGHRDKISTKRSTRAKKGRRKSSVSEPLETSTSSDAVSDPVKGATLTKLSATTDLGQEIDPKSNLILFCPFLHYETALARREMHCSIRQVEEAVYRPLIDLSDDELLLRAHLTDNIHGLHIRRTLDQFFYSNIDTIERDEDQVVYRYQTKPNSLINDPKIFMVDQLWMWVLGKDLIVTSFPQRWAQPTDDPLNTLNGIIEDVNSKTRGPVGSVFDLALLITSRCFGVFDRHRVWDAKYQFLEMFESSIGDATDRETALFKQFNDASREASMWLKSNRKPNRLRSLLEASFRDRRHGHGSRPTELDFDNDNSTEPLFVDHLLDIGNETHLLTETKDIRDEIGMIVKVLNDQVKVLGELQVNMCEIYYGEHRGQEEIKRRVGEQIRTVEVALNDLKRMDRQALRIYESMTHLLDLKQKHANAFEARFARDQAAGTARQSQTIMVFTIVTIVFLPLSFIASFFTINIQGFPRDSNDNINLPMGYISRYVFGIGFAISIPLIAIVLSLQEIGDAWRASRGFLARSNEFSLRWRKTKISETASVECNIQHSFERKPSWKEEHGLHVRKQSYRSKAGKPVLPLARRGSGHLLPV